MIVPRKKAQNKQRKKTANRSRTLNRAKKKRSSGNGKGKKKNQDKRSKRREGLRLKKLRIEKERVIEFADSLATIIGNKIIDLIARSTRFLIRESKITPISFLSILCFQQFGNGAISLSLLAANIKEKFNIDVTPKAISARLAKKETVNFFKKMLQQTIKSKLKLNFENGYKKLLGQYTEVRIEDSSILTLHTHKGIKKFKGCGGGSSKSSVKINYSYDILTSSKVNVEITSGIIPDQKLSKETAKKVKAGSLSIRDLGYFNLESFITIMKNAFFISRFNKQTHIYLKETDLQPVETNAFLSKELENAESIDQIVYIGDKKRLAVRLVAEKVPEEVKMQRAKRYKKERKKEPTEDYIIWSGFSVFITNIPKETFSASVIIFIYKIRWQIELRFKSLKSTLEVHVLKGENDNYIACMIYAKLISVVLASAVISYATSICEEDEELSEDKAMKWLHNDNRFGIAMMTGKIKELLELMITIYHTLCKDKRNTQKSTYARVKAAIHNEVGLEKYAA